MGHVVVRIPRVGGYRLPPVFTLGGCLGVGLAKHLEAIPRGVCACFCRFLLAIVLLSYPGRVLHVPAGRPSEPQTCEKWSVRRREASQLHCYLVDSPRLSFGLSSGRVHFSSNLGTRVVEGGLRVGRWVGDYFGSEGSCRG